MELLLILGVLAVVAMLALGAFLFLQQRRAGTIRAVIPPRRGRNRLGDDGEARRGEK